jgi:lipoic acid synthetase
LKKTLPSNGDPRTRHILEQGGLSTVCQSAECPNRGECWDRGAAAFMILGETCTRSCGFCAVKTGPGRPLDDLDGEPLRLARAVGKMGLRHVVITSVTRDDLPDEGAGHFARVIEALREHGSPDLVIEVLVPDFHAREECIRTVLQAPPDVYNHNVETVQRLYPTVRPQAEYRRSLEVLRRVRRLAPEMVTKSGIMVGLGETREEVKACLRDLRGVGCEILTVGQYLSPSPESLPVEEFIHPDVFKEYEAFARKIGFKNAACGPFVRSSYQADQVLNDIRKH